MADKVLSVRELRRYQSQIDLLGIGQEGQARIKSSRILVVGAGGKGTAVLRNLITAGVGYIGICDDGLIHEDSLAKQCLFGDNDVGKQKTIVTKEYLEKNNRYTEIKVHNIKITANNIRKVIHKYDFLIDATNNSETLLALNHSNDKINIPLILGSTVGNKGLITVCNSSDKINCASFLNHKKNIVGENDSSGMPFIILNSITGVILANEAFKIILKRPSELSNKLLTINLSNYSFDIIKI